MSAPEDQTTRRVVRRLHEVRRLRRMSQEALSRATGIPRSVIANVESGRRSYITIDELVTVAGALDVDPCDVLSPDPFTLNISSAVIE